MFSQPLDKESYPLYIIKNYNKNVLSLSEFNEDVKHFQRIKTNLNRYNNKTSINIRLILNQIIILTNIFTTISVTRILYYICDDAHYDLLTTFFTFLNIYDEVNIIELRHVATSVNKELMAELNAL